MLIAKIYINNEQIDQINIHNTGKQNPVTGSYTYEVVDKNDKRIIPDTFEHKRDKGYRPLLKKVLGRLDVYGIKTSKHENSIFEEARKITLKDLGPMKKAILATVLWGK